MDKNHTNLEDRITFRLLPEERRLLEHDAGGSGKVSAYVRGLIRGARVATQSEREGQRERQTA